MLVVHTENGPKLVVEISVHIGEFLRLIKLAFPEVVTTRFGDITPTLEQVTAFCDEYDINYEIPEVIEICY